MKEWLKGYTALLREMAWLRNDGAFLSLPGRWVTLVLVCGIIGLVRNALSVELHVLSFYRFEPDILWTMFVWPVHLWLFPGALLHAQLRRMGYPKISLEAIFGLTFYLQILHLIIPIFDWLGFRLGMPWMYELVQPPANTDWYSNFLVMTPGIILAWLITAYLTPKVLNQRLGIHWLTVAVTSSLTFIVILIPTYFVWPTFNTLFNRAFGLWVLNPLDHRLQVPRQIYWGYGTYFAVTALLGAGYFWWQRLKAREAAPC